MTLRCLVHCGAPSRSYTDCDLSALLPDDAQPLISEAGVRPDFYYDVNGSRVAVFVDGPHHDEPAQEAKDRENDEKLWNLGIEPLRIHHQANWPEIFAEHANIFGTGTE